MDIKKKKTLVQNMAIAFSVKVSAIMCIAIVFANIFMETEYQLWDYVVKIFIPIGILTFIVYVWLLSTLNNKKSTILDNKSSKMIFSIITLSIISDIFVVGMYLCYLQCKTFAADNQFFWSNLAFGIMIIALLLIVTYIGMMVWKDPKEIITNIKTGKYKPKLTKKEKKQAFVFKFLIILMAIILLMIMFCGYQFEHDVEHAEKWNRCGMFLSFIEFGVIIIFNVVGKYFKKKNNGKNVLKKL